MTSALVPLVPWFPFLCKCSSHWLHEIVPSLQTAQRSGQTPNIFSVIASLEKECVKALTASQVRKQAFEGHALSIQAHHVCTHGYIIEHIKTDMADRRSPRIYRTTCNGPMLSSAPKLMQSRSKKFKTSLHLGRTEDPGQFEHRQPLMGMYVYVYVYVCVWMGVCLSLVGYCTLSSCLYSSDSAKPSLKERPSPPPPGTKKIDHASQTPHPVLKSVATQTQLILILEDLPARSCKYPFAALVQRRVLCTE